MSSGSSPVEPNCRCHSSSNPISQPNLTMISAMPPSPGCAIPPTYSGKGIVIR
ncbi:hypothetical protein BJX62DRAFT_203540 [Aspergillus germanicus]